MRCSVLFFNKSYHPHLNDLSYFGSRNLHNYLKTAMKKFNLISLLFFTFICLNRVHATDRIVQMSGPVGTYSSIGAAITAAVDGDIIVINNRLDGLPWQENLSIAKSLTFISAVDNLQWWMEGTVTINLAEGRLITISGMKNTLSNGNITRTGALPVNRTVVNIVNCDISGTISLANGVNFYLGSSKVNGDVAFSYGKIIGNEITRSLLCYSDVATEDVNMVVGNKIGSISNTSNPGFYHLNSTQYLYLANNFIKGGSSSVSGATISSLKSGTSTNRIVNNTMTSNNTVTYSTIGTQALYINFNTGATLVVENNLLCANFVSASNGGNAIHINQGAATTNLYFNMYYNPSTSMSTTLSTSLGNFSSNTALSTALSADGVMTGSLFVNAGNASNAYLDLDLTRNDIGCYGGSYSLTNFLPIMNNPESSRVNFVTAPRIVPQGGTVNVQAIGFDK